MGFRKPMSRSADLLSQTTRNRELSMEILVFCALGLLLGVLVVVWLVGRIRYRIGSRHLKVVLFGLVLRRVNLLNIESISKRRTEGLTEHWWSTIRPKHRVLVIRRRRGLCRNFVITPRNRYIFRADLERAISRAGGNVDPAAGEQSQMAGANLEAESQFGSAEDRDRE
jgi:hypothetical protein